MNFRNYWVCLEHTKLCCIGWHAHFARAFRMQHNTTLLNPFARSVRVLMNNNLKHMLSTDTVKVEFGAKLGWLSLVYQSIFWGCSTILLIPDFYTSLNFVNRKLSLSWRGSSLRTSLPLPAGWYYHVDNSVGSAKDCPDIPDTAFGSWKNIRWWETFLMQDAFFSRSDLNKVRILWKQRKFLGGEILSFSKVTHPISRGPCGFVKDIPLSPEHALYLCIELGMQ